MDSGPETPGRIAPRREPDALDLWFARQRRAWWKRWWWVVAVAGALMFSYVIVDLASIVHLGMGWYMGNVQPPPWWTKIWPVFLPLARARVRVYLSLATLAAALVLGTGVSKATIPPAEIALSRDKTQVFRHLNRFARRRLWIDVAALYIIPNVALSFATIFAAGGYWPLSQRIAWTLYGIVFTLASGALAVEGQACVLRRIMTKRRLSWPLLLPFAGVLCAVIGERFLWIGIGKYFPDLYRSANFSGGLWVALGLWAVVLALGVSLAYVWRNPLRGFTGAAER